MTYRLYDFGASPFCIKVRAILDYKGIPFERINTAGTAMLELRRKGRIGKVPALDTGDSLICDSTDIAHALEDRHPTPPILPAAPRERALCHVLEDWADESLYWLGVHFRWRDDEGRGSAGAIFPKGFLTSTMLPYIIHSKAISQLKGQGVGRKSPEHVARDLARQLLHLSALLEDGPFLLGDAPMLCDFAVCGQLVYLARTPHGEREIAQYPAVSAFLERMKALRKQRSETRNNEHQREHGT